MDGPRRLGERRFVVNYSWLVSPNSPGILEGAISIGRDPGWWRTGVGARLCCAMYCLVGTQRQPGGAERHGTTDTKGKTVWRQKATACAQVRLLHPTGQTRIGHRLTEAHRQSRDR